MKIGTIVGLAVIVIGIASATLMAVNSFEAPVNAAGGAPAKPVDKLTLDDLRTNPVWVFADDEQKYPDETFVLPEPSLPVATLDSRVVGTEVRLANGTKVWSLIGNVDVRDACRTAHFLTLAVERKGHWFHLARYHDIDRATHGPDALCRFLGLRPDEVFPISYDLRAYTMGTKSALVGRVVAEPGNRLNRTEVIALAVGEVACER